MLNIFNRHKKPPTLSVRDIVNTLLVGAAIIAFWRGVWELLDIYLFPNHPVTSALASIVLGVGILLLMKRFKMDYL